MSGAEQTGDGLNLREQIVRIDRSIAESEKLQAETRKFLAEAMKLGAEARKYRWDPWFVIAGAVLTGLFLRLPDILQTLGLARAATGHGG